MEGLFISTFFQKKNMSSWLFKDKNNYSNPCGEKLHSLTETETNAESWFTPASQSGLACSNRFFAWIFRTTRMRHHPGFRHDLFNAATAEIKKTNKIIKQVWLFEFIHSWAHLSWVKIRYNSGLTAIIYIQIHAWVSLQFETLTAIWKDLHMFNFAFLLF